MTDSHTYRGWTITRAVGGWTARNGDELLGPEGFLGVLEARIDVRLDPPPDSIVV